MKPDSDWILGLVLGNLVLVYYEHRGTRGWRPYFATIGILLLAVIFKPLAIFIVIPLTAWNLLMNTFRIRGLPRPEEGG